MELRLARQGELETLKKLYKGIVDHLHEIKEVRIWYDGYPMNILGEDMDKRQLYVVEEDGNLIGAVALTDDFTHEMHFNWKVKGKSIYINRFGVFMDYKGKGYARPFMNKIKEFAAENNCKSVRLMVNHHNAPAIATYEKSGFIWTGDRYAPPLYPNELLLGYEVPLE
ncbi:MAG: GNAT family N-acetyltransferase [Firmicutes bacterium]|nr:GNAT family N-acetyltransferase [Bacillota bacterium]